jgi:hypothetical protein
MKRNKKNEFTLSGLFKILRWLDKRGIAVEFNARISSEYRISKRKIIINSNLSPDKTLFYLLHESGHAIIDLKKKVRDNLKRKFNKGLYTRQNLALTIEEEVLAWQEGEKLAKRLRLWYDEKEFDRLKRDSLATYLDFSAQSLVKKKKKRYNSKKNWNWTMDDGKLVDEEKKGKKK